MILIDDICYRGSFAVVKKATNKKTGEKVAIKIISKYIKYHKISQNPLTVII